MTRKLLLLLLLPLFSCETKPKTIVYTPQESGSKSHIRGLMAVNDSVCWYSASKGIVGLTMDGGKSWTTTTVQGADSLDFRDIEAFSGKRALILSAGSPGRIYLTENAGLNWKMVHEDTRPEIFYDGMDFANKLDGAVYGDPINGEQQVLHTANGGMTWEKVSVSSDDVPILKQEAGFAASGSGLAYLANGEIIYGLGGDQARTISYNTKVKKASVSSTPLSHGAPAKGIYSIAFKDNLNGLAVGGEYLDSTMNNSSMAITTDGGKTWTLPSQPAKGYTSSVCYVPDSDIAVAVGRYGSYLSEDNGMTWRKTDKEAFYTVSFSPSGKYGWVAGAYGKIARIEIRRE
ncbi:oxidoreductase [Fulvitalea axinellae]|uniref:Oxidoreductase n=1 Tax=Fulvitalea axinellae TaxID=1182444 RepID=A0AAU9CK24_9BACT|nr:oxidoreductase [Fulvitalea axinellae]